MKRLKLSDVAKELQVKKSIIRQWEKEFDLSTKGQNAYSVEDMKVFVHIKELIKTKGLSIQQAVMELEKHTIPAKKIIEEKTPKTDIEPEIEATPIDITPEDVHLEPMEASPEKVPGQLKSRLSEFKENLLNLKKLLN